MQKGQWTPEERRAALQQAREVAEFGIPPAGPVDAGGNPAPADEQLFGAGDLAELAYRSEWFQMTPAKGFWVHPTSLTEAAWLNSQAVRQVKRLNLTDPTETEFHARFIAQCFQVVMCCRTGPEAGAPVVFPPSAWETLYRDRRVLDRVQRICALSDALTNNDETFQAQLRDFFGELQRFLTTCASQLTTDTLESSRAALEGCASSVSRMSSGGRLDLTAFPFPE